MLKYRAMKTYWGSGGIASRFGGFTPEDRALGTHWLRDWEWAPEPGLDTVARRKISSPCLASNPGRPINGYSVD